MYENYSKKMFLTSFFLKHNLTIGKKQMIFCGAEQKRKKEHNKNQKYTKNNRFAFVLNLLTDKYHRQEPIMKVFKVFIALNCNTQSMLIQKHKLKIIILAALDMSSAKQFGNIKK